MAGLLLRGLFPAFPTPTTPDGDVDIATLARLVEYQVAGGVAGLVPLGGTGEATALSLPARRRVAEATVAAAAGRVMVMAGVLDPGLGDAVETARAYEAAGVDALMVIPPYYARPDQAGVHRYFRALSQATRLDLVLYDNPFRSHVVLAPETIAAMAAEGLIAGMKASNTDLYHLNRLAPMLPPGFGLLSGQDTLFVEQVLMGARGGVLTSACLVPQAWNRIQALVEAGDAAAALALHRRLQPLMDALFAEAFPDAVRLAFGMIGLPLGPSLTPSGTVSPAGVAVLRAAIEGLVEDGLLSLLPA